MRSITVNLEPVNISINGMEFTLLKSDGEIAALGRDAMARCAALDIGNPDAVRACLAWICAEIDEILGSGSVAKLIGNKPVSMIAALKLLNGLTAASAEAYREYLRREYLHDI